MVQPNMAYYQIWFTVKELPELTEAQTEVYQAYLSNLSDNIGNVVEGRILKRCLFDGSLEEIVQIGIYLQSLGKEPKYCGVRGTDGNWVIAKDQAEFDKHIQPSLVDGTLVFPSDNTSAGYPSFNDAVTAL